MLKRLLKLPLLPLVFLLLAAAVIHAHGLPGGFLHDDYPVVVDNTSLRITDLSFNSLASVIQGNHGGGLHRPVSMLSIALNQYFLGDMAVGFKWVNIFLHLVNGLLAYCLARLIFRHMEIPAERAVLMALAVSAAWLLHPQQVATVHYVVQRMTQLSTLFVFLGMAVRIQYRPLLDGGTRPFVLMLTAQLLLLALAIGSKENGALLPAYLLLLEISVFRSGRGADTSSRVPVLLLLAGLLFPVLLLVLWFDPLSLFSSYQYRLFDLEQRLWTEARVMWMYLSQILLPLPDSFGFFHDDITLSAGWLNPVSTLPAVIALISVALMAVALRNRMPLVSFGLLFYLLSHCIESTVLPLELMYEHRNYIGLLGLFLAMISLSHEIYRRARLVNRTGLSLLLCWLLSLPVATWQRTGEWQSVERFLQVQTERYPESMRAQYYSARWMLEKYGYASAAPYYKRAVENSEEHALPLAEWLIAAARADDETGQEYFRQLLQRIEHKPLTHEKLWALTALVDCLRSACQQNPLPVLTLISNLQDRVDIGPEPAARIAELGAVLAGEVMNMPTEAEGLLRQALKLDPNSVQRKLNLALFLHRQGNSQPAQELLQELLQDRRSEQNRTAIQTLIEALRLPVDE